MKYVQSYNYIVKKTNKINLKFFFIGSQHLGILLSEDEDQILEGAGKPRMKSSGSTSSKYLF